MKSIPIALTWEFWRQTAVPLAATTAGLAGFIGLLYGGLRLEGSMVGESAIFTILHAVCFIIIVAFLAAIVCQSTAPPTQRFTLPVAVHTSIFIPMLNGVLATVCGYLAIALLANGLFNAQWTLIKPTLMAVCMITVCQAACSLNWQSPHLRGMMVAGLASALGIGMIYLNGSRVPEQIHRDWQTIRPFEVCLAVTVPVLAYTYSVITLALARHGTELSLSAIGRWLLVRLDFNLQWKPRCTTPMSAELRIDWITRGVGLPAGAILVTTIICGFLLSGRFDWQSARDGIIAMTGAQVMIAPIYGLFMGHVGQRFDFDEYSATRPLSDIQLADVKLRNSLKAVCWTWIFWAIGVAFGAVCLTIVGQGPTSWSAILPPGTNPLVAVLVVLMVPLASWTLMSLGISVSILRPWLIKTVIPAIALLPAVAMVLIYSLPESEREIIALLQWSWIGFSIVGTIALYATALRLRLITIQRVAMVGVVYLLCCAMWLSWASVSPSPGTPMSLAIGFAFSNAMLPFVCVTAVPLAIWWNRHR